MKRAVAFILILLTVYAIGYALGYIESTHDSAPLEDKVLIQPLCSFVTDGVVVHTKECGWHCPERVQWDTLN